MSELIKNDKKHIRYIDGLRGMAILIVVLSHAGLGWIIPGKFGVTLFFFISGYLITKLLMLETEEKGRIRLRDFYLRRLFRLYPALLVMTGLSCLFGWLLLCPIPWQDILAALFYFTNYYIGWIRPVVPDCFRLLDIIWSLSVEEHFYFFFPFITGLLLGDGSIAKRKIFQYVLFALCILALACRCWLYLHDFSTDPNGVAGRVYFSTHMRMDSILWGCIASFWLFGGRSARFVRLASGRLGFFAGLILLLLSFTIRWEAFRQTFLFTFQGVGLLLVVPSLHFSRLHKIRSLLELPWLQFIGRISYSLYLFHWGASKLANHWFVEHSLRWQLLFWPLSIALTLFSYYCVEKPFVSLRRRFGSTALR